MSKWPATSLISDMANDNDNTFNYFVNKITQPLLNISAVFLSTTPRDIYWSILQEHGNQYWETYRSSLLKKRLQNNFQDKIVFFPQGKGSDVVCSSSLPIGDVLIKLKQFQDTQLDNNDANLVLNAARVLRESVKSLKLCQTQTLDDLLDVPQKKPRE